MEVKAHVRFLHMSPRKVRRVAQLISGLPVARAEAELLVRNERAADPLRKLLRSALANARQVSEAGIEDMKIQSFIVNSGPVMKRFRPRSRGMAHPYTKRMSHVSIILQLPDAPRKQGREVVVPKPEIAAVSSGERTEEKKPQSPESKPPRPQQRSTPKLPKFSRRFFQRKSV